MNIIKVYRNAVDEKVFFKGVREYLLNKNLTGAFNEEVAEEIRDAFMAYLDDNYPSGEAFYYSQEDREACVDNFLDEIFSWLSDDFEELIMGGTESV